MKNLKWSMMVLCATLVVAGFYGTAVAQSEDRGFASLSGSGSGIRLDVSAPHAGMTLTVSAPDGQVFRKEFKDGASADFTLVNSRGEKLPDGHYSYELRLTPVLSSDVRETLSKAREKGNDADVERDLRKRGILPSQPMVQSGGFSILNGSVIVAGATEPGAARSVGKVVETPRVSTVSNGATLSRLRQHHARLSAMPDFVIADDLIVQGSACVGIDCVNGEVFGFDTIRVKENNTRIQFDDTSVTAGFPTNNWQIRANSSASGGASFLAFVDQGSTGNSETGTIVFEVDAGAPANSIKVASTGRVGFRTATPVLDLHTNTSNTPALRLEQNSSGGFTAQTWDVAGNEANFFIRDVTSGSRLPFRIRPGAPTSSIDIAASGNVGIGTASPVAAIHVLKTLAADTLVGRFENTSSTGYTEVQVRNDGGTNNDRLQFGIGGTATGDIYQNKGYFLSASGVDGLILQASSASGILQVFTGGSTERMRVTASGEVGIGTTAPTDLLSVNGNASKPGGGSWSIFSDERLKKIKGRFNSGLKAVMQLEPVRFEYKANNALGLKSTGEHIGFGAQSLQQIIPEAVSSTDNGYLMVNNDPILWTMLNAIKEQQKEIEQLKAEVKQLRAASRKRR